MSNQWIATPTRTAAIMKQYDIQMKKSLGQNFLIEPNILEKMIASGQITKNTTVIEIGPGIGALTEFLAVHAKQVFAFEIDARFVDILSDTLQNYDNVHIIHQDILQVDFSDPEYQTLQEAEDLVVCANLPYYITTPIILHLMMSSLPFRKFVMMMQKEVAQRMTAQVGSKSYNSLTIAIENNMVTEIEFIVPKNVFIPKPNVDSAVLSLSRREQPLVEVDSTSNFEHFVRLGFAQRRKTLWNNYKSSLLSALFDTVDLQFLFEQTGIDPQRRAEALDIYEFHKLYESYQAKLSANEVNP